MIVEVLAPPYIGSMYEIDPSESKMSVVDGSLEGHLAYSIILNLK